MNKSLKGIEKKTIKNKLEEINKSIKENQENTNR